MVVISASMPMVRTWFRFDENVNFKTCMPQPFKL